MNQANHKLWQLIVHYLHKHNDLCLEGLGSFVAIADEVMVDPVAKKITPAHKKINFKPGEINNSESFLNFATQVTGEERKMIVDKIADLSESFYEGLEQSQKLEIENFGTFKVVGDTVNFEQFPDIIFDENTFGLIPVQFAANLVRTKRIVVDKTDEEDEELTQMRESALKELKVLLDNARIAETNTPKKKSNIFPVIATVLTLILLLNLGFFLFKGPVDDLRQQIAQMNILGKTGEMLDTQKSETIVPPALRNPENLKVEETQEISTQISEPATPAKTEPDAVDVQTMNLIASNEDILSHIGSSLVRGSFEFDSSIYTLNAEPIVETPLTEKAESSITPEPDSKPVLSEIVAEKSISYMPKMSNVDAYISGVEKGYYVIAGAFRIEQNAIKMKSDLIKNGNGSALIFKPANYPYFLVAIQKSGTLNQALKLVELKVSQYDSIWVYCAN